MWLPCQLGEHSSYRYLNHAPLSTFNTYQVARASSTRRRASGNEGKRKNSGSTCDWLGGGGGFKWERNESDCPSRKCTDSGVPRLRFWQWNIGGNIGFVQDVQRLHDPGYVNSPRSYWNRLHGWRLLTLNVNDAILFFYNHSASVVLQVAVSCKKCSRQIFAAFKSTQSWMLKFDQPGFTMLFATTAIGRVFHSETCWWRRNNFLLI